MSHSKNKKKKNKTYSNKKITRPKIKLYANKIYEYEKLLKISYDKVEIKSKIEALVDEICMKYEPNAMYYIDEEIMKLFRKDTSSLTN